jgi:hypothetical protein
LEITHEEAREAGISQVLVRKYTLQVPICKGCKAAHERFGCIGCLSSIPFLLGAGVSWYFWDKLQEAWSFLPLGLLAVGILIPVLAFGFAKMDEPVEIDWEGNISFKNSAYHAEFIRLNSRR